MATFGNTSIESAESSMDDTIVGGKYTMGAVGGTADSISVYIKGYTGGKVKCALYDSDQNLIKSTVEREDCVANSWNIFVFGDPKPELDADTDYILLAWSDGATVTIAAVSGAPANSHWFIGMAYTSWPDPVGNSTSSYFRSIYCTYTEPGGEETHDPSDTAKASDSLAFKPGIPLSDTAKASDIPAFKPGIPLSDLAKASDSIAFKVFHGISDTAKAQDIIFPDKLTLTDTAKANDSVTYSITVVIATPTENVNIYR